MSTPTQRQYRATCAQINALAPLYNRTIRQARTERARGNPLRARLLYARAATQALHMAELAEEAGMLEVASCWDGSAEVARRDGRSL